MQRTADGVADDAARRRAARDSACSARRPRRHSFADAREQHVVVAHAPGQHAALGYEVDRNSLCEIRSLLL